MKKILSIIFLTLLCSSVVWSQTKTISGTVFDPADNSPLVGASVVIKGTTKGTITDIDGKYSINVGEADKELVFSFMGMQDRTEKIGSKTTINVTMASEATQLSDVVVTALNIKRDNKSLTAAQQTVNTTMLAEAKDQNIVASLSGKVSGVHVVPPQSSTGSARIVIRGNSSFTGNNQPLFVIDGMPMENFIDQKRIGDDDSMAGGLDMGNGASSLNPEDIESLTVLKGPNAAALYGSRAANGVILITTKKATEGRFKVSFHSNTMFKYITQWPDFQNTYGSGGLYEFDRNIINDDQIPDFRIPGQFRSLGAPMIGQDYIGLDGKLRKYEPKPGNVYDFYKTARALTNNVSVEGGNADNSYRVSLTNMNANDFIDNQNLVNNNILNLRFFNTLTKGLTLDSKLNIFDESCENRQYLNGSGYNPAYMYIFMPRHMALEEFYNYKSPEGQEQAKSGDGHNPFWSINETGNNDERMKALFNIDLAYQILPYLKVILTYGKEYNNFSSFEHRNKGALGDTDGFVREQTSTNNNDMYKALLLFDKNFGDISVNATLGGEQNDWYGYSEWRENKKLRVAGFYDLNNSDEKPSLGDHTSRKQMRSVYGALSVGYQSWVYLDLTGRNDWSSTLPVNNNNYFYPSFGISWIPTDMLKLSQDIVYGKLRASYAIVGNDTDPYKLLPYFTLNTTFNEVLYATFPSYIPNANLKPERTQSYEIGTDLRFWKGRIVVDFTFYNKESSDQIIEAAMDPSSGYSKQIYNSGTIRNRGVELTGRVVPVKTKSFSYEIFGNFTKNNSLVLAMPDGKPLQIRTQYNSRIMIEEGKPYGVIRGRVWSTDASGKRLVEDSGYAVWEDDQDLGTATPDWLLGIGNTFRYTIGKYGDVDLSFLIDMKKGGLVFSGSRRKGITAGVFSGFEKETEDWWVQSVILGNENTNGSQNFAGVQFDDIYFRKKNDDGSFAVDAKGNYIAGEKCDYYMVPMFVGFYSDNFNEMTAFESSYVKLRELSLGYNFPKQWISKVKLTNARLSLVGRNLWILYQKTPRGLDPEAADNAGNGQGFEVGGLPPNTTLGFDIKLAF